MKSGLYAWAGASATASAAACAKRFDDPITKESNVYFGLMPAISLRGATSSGSGVTAVGTACAPAGGDGGTASPLGAARVTDGCAEQIQEVPLDPLAGEVVRHGQHEPLGVDVRAVDLAEPGRVGGVVERLAEPSRDVVPEVLRRQLDLPLHAQCPLLPPLEGPRAYQRVEGLSMRISRRVPARYIPRFAGIFGGSTPVSTAVDCAAPPVSSPALSTAFPRRAACGQPGRRGGPAILARGRPSAGSFLLFGRDETDVPAERTQAEAQARVPRAHVDEGRPPDPEAPPGEGAQAPLGLTPVQRRNRLSRSRDFDAVYRQGRSVSTRFLTLWWYARDEPVGEPRLGFAVPKTVGNAVVRNRIKRQLREIVRARLASVPATNDYVLVVRQGLPEAAEANGHRWLEERVDEVLGKAAA